MKRLAVLTSGGDAPGMNAAIRAVVRTASYKEIDICGVIRGYRGLISGDFRPMNARSVDNITQRGGTILYSARSPEFFEPEGRARAAENLRAENIDALVVIGGNGSFQGAHLLAKEHGVRVIGVPGTIDNDIYGTDVTIGFHTAMNIALSAIDRLRDTGHSHDRLFLVEVMGRHSGHIALNVGIAAQTPRGLVVPVVHGAQAMTTRELAGALSGLTAKARDGGLTPRDLTGGTVTVNNYGVFGVDGSAAIIQPPQVAIVGMGRIIDRPWVVEGELAVRKISQLTIAFDHRACDGGTAGGFLRHLADCVESPVRALADL